jgi:hypothetical protein
MTSSARRQPAVQTDTASRFAGYFASGSNRVGEIRGIAAAGRWLGVAAPEVSVKAEAELHKLAGRDIPVFVDSGAFGEVRFNAPHKCSKKTRACRDGSCVGAGNFPFPDAPKFTFVVVRPISDADWECILALYERLARSLGSALYVVAPDRVGDQDVTADRLARYAARVRQLRSLGANVIVPIQRGALSAAAFDRKIERLLGFNDYVRGIPSKKGATPVKELAAFVTDLRDRVASPRIHVLGKGLPYLKPAAAASYAAALAGCVVTSDSVRICAICGKGRALYEAKRSVRRDLGLRSDRDMTPEAYAEAVYRAFAAEGGAPSASACAQSDLSDAEFFASLELVA